ncbi:MAG: oligosaccharide flippase family protein [Bacteroidia bacterium]
MLGKNIARQFLTQIFGLVSGFVTSVITARLLGPEGRGDFALLINTSTFLCLILGFNFGTSVIHIVSSGKQPVRNLVNTFFVIIPLLFVTCVSFLVVFPFEKYSFLLPANSSDRSFYILILTALFIISSYGTLFNAVLSGSKKFVEQQTVYILYYIVTIVSYCALFFFKDHLKLTLDVFLLFYCCITSVVTLGAYFMYLKHVRPASSFVFLSGEQFKYVLSFSLLAYACSIFHFLCTRMDFWLIEYFNGSKNLGLYSLPVNLAQMLWLLPQAISVILIAHSGSETEERAVQKTNTLSRIALFLVFAASIILFFTIDFFIPFFFGNKFSGSSHLFKILLTGIVPFSVTTILSSYFGGRGKMKINLYCSIIGFVFCLLFDLILIPVYGNTGAAIATGIAYTLSTLYIVFVYLKETNSTPSKLLLISKSDVSLLVNTVKNKFS